MTALQDRRTFLSLAAASLLPISVNGQEPSPAPTELARHALTGPFDGFDAVLVQLHVAPAPGSASAHRHPGPVLGYVLDGELRFAINGEPEQVVPAGGTFFEPSGAVHSTHGSARTDAPARVLVFMLVPKGSPLASPA